MTDQRRGGIIQVKRGGVQQEGKGEFTYNLGHPKRTAILGSGGKVQGFKEEAQAPFIEGKITDRGTLALSNLIDADDETITIELANGKTVVLRNAWYAGEGTGHSEEGEIDVRWEGLSAQEIT